MNKYITEIALKLVKQGKENVPLIFLLILIPIAILILIYLLSYWTNIPLSIFLKDAAQTHDTPSYTGLISDTGIFLLLGISAVCFLSYSVIHKVDDKSTRPGFFLYFGSFMLLLTIDDKFLLHEMVYSRWFSEKMVYLTYLILLAIGILKFQKELLNSKFVLILLGAGFLGMSLAVDLFQERIEEQIGEIRILIEDGFKFAGYVMWFGYFFITGREHILMTTSK